LVSKNKVKDKTKGKQWLYEKIKHNPDAIICEHCQYKEREDWLKDHLQKRKDTDTKTSKDENGVEKTITFKSITVHRGKYDDVIGVSTEWL